MTLETAVNKWRDHRKIPGSLCKNVTQSEEMKRS